jgi:parvulin-like peptidyl-prolyl isomerase
MNKVIAIFITVSSALTFLTPAAHAEDAPPAAVEQLYATVNGKPITLKEFHVAYGNYLRQKYYHGQVPEDRLAEAKKEVSDLLIERILLLDDAKRRGLSADETQVNKTIAGYESRYAASPEWQEKRNALLPGLKQQLEEQDLLNQMEAIGHKVGEPSETATREYYKTHSDLFTEPEKMRLHTILLKVDPSASKAQWDAAREEANRLIAKLRAGENSFDELASLHSHDKSAEKGGDMGYLHRGMIPDPVQAQIDAQPLGAVGAPIDVLEGIAIFRLDERIPAKLMAYADVATRAGELLKREQVDNAWKNFVKGLRTAANVKIVEANPLTPTPAKN